MNEWLEREELLIGRENIEKLNKSTVAIFGCGGVGSYVLEALVRAGVGNIVLIDKDIMSAKALILKVPNGTLYVLKSSTRIKI